MLLRKDEDIFVINVPFFNEISYRKDFLLNYFFTNDEGEIEKERMSVLFNKKYIAVLNYSESHRPELINPKDYSLEYKSKQDYYPWTDADQPSAGRLRIRITYHDFQTTQDYLYVPTQDKPVKEPEFRWKEISDIEVYDVRTWSKRNLDIHK